MKIKPSDFWICPICHGLMEAYFCPHCNAVTILPWFLLGVPE